MSRAAARPRTRAGLRAAVGLVTTLGLLGAAACAPGSSPSKPAGDEANRVVQTNAAKLGNVTLTVWDQEVRGGQNEQMRALNEAFHAKYPNITIKRVVAVASTTWAPRCGWRSPATTRPTSCRPTTAAPTWASSSRPGSSSRSTRGPRRTAGPTATRTACCSTRATRRTARTSARATSTAYHRSARSSASSTTRPKLTKLGLQPPKTWAELTSALATAKQRGETPAAARQPRQVAGRARVRRHPGPVRRPRTRSPSSASAMPAPPGPPRRTPRPPGSWPAG